MSAESTHHEGRLWALAAGIGSLMDFHGWATRRSVLHLSSAPNLEPSDEDALDDDMWRIAGDFRTATAETPELRGLEGWRRG